MLNLEWFRTFKVIYEVGTLTAAAQELYISQPGVSLHLNSLEAYTGYRLFERDNRRCVPTERATILYNFIIDPMARLQEIEQQFHRKSRTSKPTLSIGMCYMTFQYTLEQYVGMLPFNLIARFGEGEQLIEDLNNGLIDFALVSTSPVMPNIEYTPFLNQRITLVCGKEADTTRLDELKSLTDRSDIRDWLKQQSWFATSVDMEYLKNFWLANFNVPLDFKPSYVLPNFNSILGCLRNGNGFTVMPDYLCKKAIIDDQVKVPWEESTCPEKTLHFGKRKKSGYAKEIQHIEELLTTKWFA
jgi:DNA-binding transcriptional LysR family regulator